MADDDVVAQARSNDLGNFRLAFDKRFLDDVIAHMDDNEAIFKNILDDQEFRHVLMDLYASRVYSRARGNATGSENPGGTDRYEVQHWHVFDLLSSNGEQSGEAGLLTLLLTNPAKPPLTTPIGTTLSKRGNQSWPRKTSSHLTRPLGGRLPL